MDHYENLGTIGEGTYGVVLKGRHKDTGQIVAIKKFKETDEDEQVRKTALREIRILKQLKHENVVSLLEVFRRKGKLYLVFEWIEGTILEELERHPYGIGELEVKKATFQLLKGVLFCHDNGIVHRDVKPENILVTKFSAIKLCDFGFARQLGGVGAKYTDYVATRWYRSPELLVGDTEYGKPVDVWAIGCMVAEMANGVPLFPGESDIDQLFHIIRCFGRLTPRQEAIFKNNPLYVGVDLPKPHPSELHGLEPRFAHLPFSRFVMGILRMTLQVDPERRATVSELLASEYMQGNSFGEWMEQEIKRIHQKDAEYQAANMRRFQEKRRQRASAGGTPLPLPSSTPSTATLTGPGQFATSPPPTDDSKRRKSTNPATSTNVTPITTTTTTPSGSGSSALPQWSTSALDPIYSSPPPIVPSASPSQHHHQQPSSTSSQSPLPHSAWSSPLGPNLVTPSSNGNNVGTYVGSTPAAHYTPTTLFPPPSSMPALENGSNKYQTSNGTHYSDAMVMGHTPKEPRRESSDGSTGTLPHTSLQGGYAMSNSTNNNSAAGSFVNGLGGPKLSSFDVGLLGESSSMMDRRDISLPPTREGGKRGAFVSGYDTSSGDANNSKHLPTLRNSEHSNNSYANGGGVIPIPSSSNHSGTDRSPGLTAITGSDPALDRFMSRNNGVPFPSLTYGTQSELNNSTASAQQIGVGGGKGTSMKLPSYAPPLGGRSPLF